MLGADYFASACRRIRDLNDTINKLVREKGHWERRIRELGGPDYARNAPRATDSEGREQELSAEPHRPGRKSLPGAPAIVVKTCSRATGRRTRAFFLTRLSAAASTLTRD